MLLAYASLVPCDWFQKRVHNVCTLQLFVKPLVVMPGTRSFLLLVSWSYLECEAAVGDKFGKRLIFTKKKMGAQTAEANDNAGVAAANQIVGFFEKGETRFSLKA